MPSMYHSLTRQAQTYIIEMGTFYKLLIQTKMVEELLLFNKSYYKR